MESDGNLISLRRSIGKGLNEAVTSKQRPE